MEALCDYIHAVKETKRIINLSSSQSKTMELGNKFQQDCCLKTLRVVSIHCQQFTDVIEIRVDPNTSSHLVV